MLMPTHQYIVVIPSVLVKCLPDLLVKLSNIRVNHIYKLDQRLVVWLPLQLIYKSQIQCVHIRWLSDETGWW